MKPLQQRLFSNTVIPTSPEDRYVVTHHGAVVCQGTHAECMAKLHEAMSSWHIQHEEDYAAQRQQPYHARTVVGWVLPDGSDKNFLWSTQKVFADDLTPDPESGLTLYDFLLKLSGEAKRIFIQKLPVFIQGQGWIGPWKQRMDEHALKSQAMSLHH